MGKSDSQTLAVLTHVLGLLTGFVGPLIILLVSKDKSIRRHVNNALNWQLSLIIYYIISFILIFVFIGIAFIIVLAVINMVFCIMAAVKASNGEYWKYPFSITFLK